MHTIEPEFERGKAHIIIDGQWGSTGKGKLAGYLLQRYPFEVVVSDFMPNAGHTYRSDEGEEIISTALPMGAFFPRVKTVVIGPHSAFTIPRLVMEYQQACARRGEDWKLMIHPLASIVNERDAEEERKTLSPISSTMKGSAASVIRKMMRSRKDMEGWPTVARQDPRLAEFVDNYEAEEDKSIGAVPPVLNALYEGKQVLLESAQGFDLSLNWGTKWPYVTSRDCTLGRVLDNAGIPPQLMGKVIASLRTYPIRVGNTEDGFSGPYYSDQRETNWEKISVQIGQTVCERTTVTKRVRRVFTFSIQQLYRFLNMCRPDYAFLNFVNYLPVETKSASIKNIRAHLERFDCELSWVGTGAMNCEMMECWGVDDEETVI